MAFISNLQLTGFRNYTQTGFTFRERITGIHGPNGAGKTNLLDAIYYLCFTKSYFHSGADAQHIRQGSEGFRIAGTIDGCSVTAVLREGGKKEFRMDYAPYTKLSEHIGKFPAVVIAPDDIELITGPGEQRRRFIDTTLCQTDKTYLQYLIQYNRLLQQRNSLLRQLAQGSSRDFALLDVLDSQLTLPCTYIHQRRKNYLEEFSQRVAQQYEAISSGTETVALAYSSGLLESPFPTLLRNAREKDILLQRTTSGIHRDELICTLDGLPFRNRASQGQRKSLLFALKLSELALLQQELGRPPFLLLDDVFEKLDSERMRRLLLEVCGSYTGQVFITDTHEERLNEALRQNGTAVELLGL